MTTSPTGSALSLARRLAGSLAVAGLVLATGAACTVSKAPTAPAPTPAKTAAKNAAPLPTPSPTPTVRPTPPPIDHDIVFAADAVGPYVIGTPLSELEGRFLVNGVAASTTCTNTLGASATGRYAAQVTLTFTAGRLVSLHTTSPDLVTPIGAKVGMTLTEAQALYGNRAVLITGSPGNKALIVRVAASPLALVLLFDPTNTTVISINGGEDDPLELAARTGVAC